jgi:hypothetical protein
MLPDDRDLTPHWQLLSVQYCSRHVFFGEAGQMTAIMPIDEPRPRGTVHGERADRRRVREAEPDSPVKIAQPQNFDIFRQL